MSEITYEVPDMSCDHCKHAISSSLLGVDGVEAVDVNLASKHVIVRGTELDDATLRSAIDDAGYEAVA
ncbi:MAG TPA: heavy-metal-associated domain-containing protein [Gaiellaceae bacterium]|nr:heavy-metal-associated domain-containing protein [Gaiellaceae bacterium]